MRKRLLALVLTLVMVLTMLPATALAADTVTETIDFGEFLRRVEAANYDYDGKGVTVQWSPSSACTDNRGPGNHDCLFQGTAPSADGNNPQRVQNGNAQYSVFNNAEDVRIVNVNFSYTPGGFTICQNSDASRKGSFTADQVTNAEIQLMNSGSVTFANCTFDAVIASPFGSRTSSTFEQCTFRNVYNAYAIKDVYSPNLTVRGCSFEKCGGAIYLEGDTEKKEISITGNTFTDIDTYAAEGKAYTRGLIQFSANGDYSNARITITGNTSTGSAAILRQLNETVTASVVDTAALQADNKFDAEAALFVGDTKLTENKTIYLNTETGDDTNDGGESSPVKTFATAMSLVNAGDTIMVTGDLKYSIKGIDKPVTIQGAGEERVPVSGGVELPTAGGTVTFKNFSFNGTSTIGAYGKDDIYANLDLVIENCAFTQAGGNCIYINPQINSLTVTGCAFTAPESATTYAKQYLIWPYAAKTITITDNTFDGRGVMRAAIHLGDGHPDGTTAVVSGNTIENFERGVQLAFINGAANAVSIDNNTFENIQYYSENASADKKAQPYEVGTVFVHETLDKNGGKTTVSYTSNKLTGSSERIAYSENGKITADELFSAFAGNTIGGVDAGALNDNWHDAFTVQIGDVKYKSLDAALEAAKAMTGDVTITLLEDVDYTSRCSNDEGASNTISYDLSTAAGLKSLTIRGASRDVEIRTGVDGNNIDGALGNSGLPYCPKISISLPEGATLTVDNLTFPDDLQFDSVGNTVVVQNCVFNGSISGYPQAKSISYLNNTFEFEGTAERFYSHNAYPVWYKVTGEHHLDFTFDGNTVIGYRGVHVECRGGQADIKVDNNHFTLKDADHANKTIALQLVNELTGKVSFTNNYVDGYMAVCFFNGLKVQPGAKLTVENNYLVGDCKLFGSSEWKQSGATEADKIAAADEFAQKILDGLTGEGSDSSVKPGHTEHNYENGVCTICGASQPSSGSSGYAVTVEKSTNGTVTSSTSRASKGTKVTLTVKPNDGYVLDTITVKDASGNTVSLTKDSDTKYTFTMPASAVTVKATFVDEGLPFTDVSGHWALDAIEYVYENGMMNGTTSTKFGPEAQLTRGMIVTILYRLEGEPTVSGNTFADVNPSQYYADPIAWAAKNGIVTGYDETTFGPENSITREQLAAILYRYASYKGYDVTKTADLSVYADADSVSAYAKDAMSWANGEGLITGVTTTTLNPKGTATRAQVATILMRFCENIAK